MPDSCSYYDQEMSGTCHHSYFRGMQTLQVAYGPKVKECCAGHSYRFEDNCEVKHNYLGWLG
jgi:hypothetical protein